MEWLTSLLTADSVARTILILSLVAALGLMLGSVKVFGIRLGVAGVLFSGLLFGHFQVTPSHEALEFVREFGLVLFVYTVGMQVGPAFFSSFRRQGLLLNILAGSVVLMGVLTTLIVSVLGHIPFPLIIGLFSGATTNTPSLGAAQQALKTVPGMTEQLLQTTGIGYAVAYPFGIIGIILTMLLIRALFRIDPKKELQEYSHQQAAHTPVLDSIDVHVENPNLDGVAIQQVPMYGQGGVVISRVMHEGKVDVAKPDTKLFVGDIIHVVGPKDKLEQIQIIIGKRSDLDLREVESPITTRRVVVTKPNVVGKTIGELDVFHRYGITVTRVSRADIEFPAASGIVLQFGDTILAVGEEGSIVRFAADVGNSLKKLDDPLIIPVFVGMALGIVLGYWPIQLPGMSSSVKLGIAGGPLLVSLILSRVGRVGSLIWYMPISANLMLRELGIVLFLAAVGLRGGEQFVATLVSGGWSWMLWAALITILPILIMALIARLVFRLNYLTLCGILSGSMTDPPALAYANTLVPSGASSVAYATVYPFVMILRIVAAQILVILFI